MKEIPCVVIGGHMDGTTGRFQFDELDLPFNLDEIATMRFDGEMFDAKYDAEANRIVLTPPKTGN